MEMSNKLKERFCKNYKLPIKIFQEPYFESRLLLFNDLYDSINKYNIFKEELKRYSSEEEYFEKDNEFLDQVINHIKNTEGYKQFNNQIMPQENKFIDELQKKRSKEIYTQSNVDKILLSIDLKSANFQALKYFDKNIFNCKENWEDFLSLFTNEYTKINSKHLRQVIFGACNPPRTIKYEKHLTFSLLEKILEDKDLFSENEIVSIMNDEIIFDISDIIKLNNNIYSPEIEAYIENITQKIKKIYESLKLECHIEVFKLEKAEDNATYIKNYFIDKKIKYKKINALTLPFIVRSSKNEKPEEEDFVFIYENNLCKLINNPIQNI